MFEPIISGAFLIGALIAACLGFLFGMFKKWQLTFLKIASTALSVFLAIIITKLLVADGTAYGLSELTNYIPPEFAGDVEAIVATPAVSDAVAAIVSMTLAPILFTPVFLILKLLLSFAKAPLARLWVNKAEHNKTWNNNKWNYDKWAKKKLLTNKKFKMSSALLGALSGFMFFYAISITNVFGLSMMGKYAKPIVANLSGNDPTLIEICDAAADNKAVTIMELTGGSIVYDHLISYSIDGHYASLEDEVDFIYKTTETIINIVNTDNYDGSLVKKNIDDWTVAYNKTNIMPSIISGTLSTADAKWDKGEAFFGITRPSLPAPFTPISDTFFEIMSGGDVDAMKADLISVFKIIGVLCEDAPISSVVADPMSFIGNKELSVKLFEAFYSSGRLYKIVPAITECGIDLMSSTLQLHTDKNATYSDIIEKLIAETQGIIPAADESGALNIDYDALSEQLAPKVASALKKAGIDAKSDSCVQLSRTLIECAVAGQLNSDTVTNLLSTTQITVLEADETTESNIMLSFDTFVEKTQLVYMDSVVVNYDKPADVKKEATLLAESFSIVGTVAGSLTGEEITTETLITDFGKLLDGFTLTHTIGPESSKNLLICILQSERVTDTLKLDILQVTHVANHIAGESENESYSALLENVFTAISIIDGASKNENITDKVQDLIMNMTPATSSTIQQFVKPENMVNFGIPEESAEPTSKLVSNIFGNLSDAKESGNLTEEEYKAEAEAVSDIINVAMSAASGNSNSLFEDEQSVTDFVDRVSDSKVMSQTIIDSVYDEEGNKNVDPLNLGVQLSDDNKAELVEAMNQNLAEVDESEKEEKQKLLIAAAALVNVEVQINENGEFVLPTNFPFN